MFPDYRSKPGTLEILMSSYSMPTQRAIKSSIGKLREAQANSFFLLSYIQYSILFVSFLTKIVANPFFGTVTETVLQGRHFDLVVQC